MIRIIETQLFEGWDSDFSIASGVENLVSAERALEMGETQPTLVGEAGIVYSFKIKNLATLLLSP